MRRILFEIPLPFLHRSFPVYSYGFMLMVAFLWPLPSHAGGPRKKVSTPTRLQTLGFMLSVQEFWGARVFYIIQFFGDYRGNLLSIFKVYEGGLVYYGGLFAAIVTLFIFVKKHRLSFLNILDIVTPSAALGLGFGRIGCFLNGCCFGKIAPHIPWAIQFPRTMDKTGMVDGSPAFLHQYELGFVRLSDAHALPIHPTQLYSFLADVALFFILSVFFKYRKRNGEVFLLFGIIYPIIRFCMEALRSDNPLFFNLFTIAQIVSISMFVVSIPLFAISRIKPIRSVSKTTR